MDTLGCEASLSEITMRTLRDTWAKIGASSQRRESPEQLARKLADALSKMPYAHPLGKREAGMETARSFLLGMRQAFQALGVMSDSSVTLTQTWKSLPDAEKDWSIMAICRGIWCEEWPGVPRVAKDIKKRVDRLRGLGNAVVPAQAREAFERLMGLK